MAALTAAEIAAKITLVPGTYEQKCAAYDNKAADAAKNNTFWTDGVQFKVTKAEFDYFNFAFDTPKVVLALMLEDKALYCTTLFKSFLTEDGKSRLQFPTNSLNHIIKEKKKEAGHTPTNGELKQWIAAAVEGKTIEISHLDCLNGYTKQASSTVCFNIL